MIEIRISRKAIGLDRRYGSEVLLLKSKGVEGGGIYRNRING